uniref:Pentatricopeptide repeat-containing protein n=1 Tax=Ananas comosus var. bracteatus TaxID=296719 RepID=A0A6V7P656_ANACO|nr:unnamed protein product [Ananas comosus var. bracteatus]
MRARRIRLPIISSSMGLCRAEQVDRGHEILQRIRMDGTCMPNVVTYTSVISGYCKMGRMEEAFRVFNDMIGLGIKPSRVTYNVLIDGYGKAGDMPSAASVYERMALCGCPPDVVTITSLIDGHCRNGQLDDALKLWNEMGRRELRPNIYTFATMINFLCKKNRLGEAQVLLKELNERTDIIPRAFCVQSHNRWALQGGKHNAYCIQKQSKIGYIICAGQSLSVRKSADISVAV